MYKIVIDGRVSFINVWTDDVDGVCDDPRDGRAIRDAFNERWGVTDCDPRFMLGVQREWTTNGQATEARHTQVAYIEELWNEFKDERSGQRQPKRPADDFGFTDEYNNVIVPGEEEAAKYTAKGYRKLVGSLLWPSRNCYPQIAYAVAQLARCMEKPSKRSWESAMHTLHYLYGIRNEGIVFRSDADPVPRTWYDSGHMQDRTDYRSQYGYVITWYGAPIIWTSKKHQHVGESSAEDEYMAMNHAAKHTVWLRHLLEEMGLQRHVSEPTILLGDNQQAGKWSREDMVTSGNRFIERQYYKVRDWIRTGVLESRYVNTRVNCSDLMTKAVSVETATELGGMLSGTNSLPPIPEREDSLKRF